MVKSVFLFLILACVASAQTVTNEDSLIETTTAPGAFKFTWQGQAGRTYFIQNSTDLQTWVTLPIIESGTGARIEYGFTSSAQKIFFRLRFSDLPLASVLAADFDGDGISNGDEIQLGLDPFNPDTDGDGMPDGYEFAMGLNPLVSDGTGDLDGDGVPNQEDARPNNASIGRLTVTMGTPADETLIP